MSFTCMFTWTHTWILPYLKSMASSHLILAHIQQLFLRQNGRGWAFCWVAHIAVSEKHVRQGRSKSGEKITCGRGLARTRTRTRRTRRRRWRSALLQMISWQECYESRAVAMPLYFHLRISSLPDCHCIFTFRLALLLHAEEHYCPSRIGIKFSLASESPRTVGTYSGPGSAF